MDRRMVGLIIAILIAFGCGTVPGPTAKPSFDVSRVRNLFAGECIASTGPPDLICQAVDFRAMTADGQTLKVQTWLTAEERVYATRICDEFAKTHRDSDNLTFGFREVQVLGANGEQFSVCSVQFP